MTYVDIRQRAIELIQQLPPERLSDAVHWLEALNGNDEETALVEIIQQRLSPNEQKRFDELRDRSEYGILNAAEQQEFIAYADRLEQQNVARLQAMIKLAEIRNTDLPTLNRQFRLEPPNHHAV